MTVDEFHDGETGVDTSYRDGTLTVSGEIDSASAAKFQRALDAHPDSSLIVDFAGVRFCDSSGLGCLLRAVRRGQQVTVINTQPHIRRVLEITGVLGLAGFRLGE